MENTTIADPDCQWYQNHSYPAFVFGYFVATPIYFVFGGIGHFICLAAFFRQRKTESAYTYQLFVIISETLEIVAVCGYSTTFCWFSGVDGQGGANWFMSCYSCMWYAGRLSIPLLNMFVTSSLFFSVSMAADRIFALAKPFLYDAVDRKRHQAVAFVFCYAIGIATSLFDMNRFRVVESSGLYKIIPNDEYVSSEFALIAAHIRNATRIFGVLALTVCNVTLLITYRLRVKKRVFDEAQAQDEAEVRRRNTERMLILLAVLDSLLNASSISMLITYYTVVYAVPTFFSCAGSLYTPLMDGIIAITDIGDFYLAFAVSRQFRGMVLELPLLSRLVKKPQTAAMPDAPRALSSVRVAPAPVALA